MELKFTGIGAAYYPVLGSNCAFFEHGALSSQCTQGMKYIIMIKLLY